MDHHNAKSQHVSRQQKAAHVDFEDNDNVHREISGGRFEPHVNRYEGDESPKVMNAYLRAENSRLKAEVARLKAKEPTDANLAAENSRLKEELQEKEREIRFLRKSLSSTSATFAKLRQHIEEGHRKENLGPKAEGSVAAMAKTLNPDDVTKWTELFRKLDTNSDNLISLEEFIEGMRRIKTDRLNAISVEVRSDFKAIDKDGSGSISSAELRSHLKIPYSEVDAIVMAGDLDGDGELNEKEFALIRLAENADGCGLGTREKRMETVRERNE